MNALLRLTKIAKENPKLLAMLAIDNILMLPTLYFSGFFMGEGHFGLAVLLLVVQSGLATISAILWWQILKEMHEG